MVASLSLLVCTMPAKKGSKNAAPKCKKVVSKAAVAQTTTVNLDDAEHERATKRIKKTKESHDTKIRNAVNKCIRDNLAGMTEHEIHKTLVNGVSCFQQLFNDKSMAMAKIAGAPAFGKHYFNELRNLHSVHEAAEGLEILSDAAPN